MDNKNLVVLSENELENISGGVNKKALGDAVEYGTAAVMMFPFGLVGKLLGCTVLEIVECKGKIGAIVENMENSVLGVSSSYIPIYGLGVESITGEINWENVISNKVAGAGIIASELGAMAGGWFAGRAIGKKNPQKIGALKNINPLRLI